MALQARERVFGAAQNRQVAQLLREGVVGHVFHRRAEGELRVGVGAGVELLGREEQALGRQGRALGVALDEAVAVLRVLPEALEGGFEVAVQHHGGGLAEVVKDGGGLLEEQRQVVLDAGGGHAVAHVLVDAALGRVAIQQFAPAAAKFGACRVVHREFAAGQQTHLGHRVEAALAVGVEGADAVDLVVEQIHPVGHL